jgi:ribosomal protein S18 acetylase RimI-like enzyme
MKEGIPQVQVTQGLPTALRQDAARLYWQAFGGKLGRIFGPDEKAIAFLTRVIRTDHCFCVLDEQGTLLGIAGFKSDQGSFASGAIEDLRAIYGPVGASWRSVALNLLQREVDNDRFLIDGICVSKEMRGRGIGSALLRALIVEARWRGFPAIRLDVVDSNLRARALYERMGFSPWRKDSTGALKYVFGFDRSTAMIRELSQGE